MLNETQWHGKVKRSEGVKNKVSSFRSDITERLNTHAHAHAQVAKKGVVGDFYTECLHFTTYATHGAQRNCNNHTDNTILYVMKE